ncbi:phospholipid phosphatase 4 [Anopheles merus]|uniref:Phosphatidic acid phosphatase type 2/haloperoxidase domain-containing protein n=1 Tax=Anopheles merus TaxID=30066 RepID=A0A182V2J9_ANOME|nr:phospholipid phosphatase 4 [Anopheles merus]
MTSKGMSGVAYACGGTAGQKKLPRAPEYNLPLETVVRIALTCIYIALEFKAPFVRKIQPEELWLYRNPRTDSYVPLTMLWPIVLGVPGLAFTLHYLRTRDRQELRCTVLAFTLGLGLNGVITNTVKIAVGRPRPDFFWRCFPDGVLNDELHCTGKDMRALIDGRKSFPSGHSSFAFVGLGFLTWYLIGKLHLMNERGRGRSVRVIAAGLPLFAATMIAISRTCDYHHHWQDVTVGSLIGIVLSYLCYRQYFPAFSDRNCHVPYALLDATPSSPSRVKRAQPLPAGGTAPNTPAHRPTHYEARAQDDEQEQDSDTETRRLLSSSPAEQKEAKWI